MNQGIKFDSLAISILPKRMNNLDRDLVAHKSTSINANTTFCLFINFLRFMSDQQMKFERMAIFEVMKTTHGLRSSFNGP